MRGEPILISHGPPEVRHHIRGERTADLPVGGIEVLMHRRVTLSTWSLKKASDPYWRLYWPLNPGATVWHDGTQTLLLPGNLYLIPPHTAFDSQSGRRFSKWYVHFTVQGLEHPAAPGVYALRPTDRMRDLLATTCPTPGAAKGQPPHAPLWLLIELLALAFARAPARMWSASPPDVRFVNAMKLMGREFSTKLTLDDLGRLTGLSPRGLTKLFVQRTGFPPIRYLTELRLNHCSRLLRHSTLSIEEIADQCGFANRFYLGRMMRKYRQATPAAFRAQAGVRFIPGAARITR